MVFLCATAGAQWSDSFDAYTVNQGVIGRGGWEGWDNNPAVDGTVSSARFVSAPYCLALRTTTDAVRQFSATSGRWTFRLKVFVPSGQTGAAWVILMNTYQPFGPYNWSSQIRFQGGRVASLGGSNFFSRAGAGMPLVPNQWADLRVDIDLDQNEQVVSYNGAVLHRTAWQFDGVLEVQALDLFSENGSAVFFDDIVFEAAPPPVEPDCNGNGQLDSADITAGTSADCDGDGIPDECLVATEFSFTDPDSIPTGGGPLGALAADLDGDGDQDLAVPSFDNSNVRVLLGDGDGGLTTGGDYAVGAGPIEMALVKANGDDRLDLATVNVNANDVSILLNNGNGTFAAAVNVQLPDRPFGIAAADVEPDGDEDLIAGGGQGTLWLLQNNGTGTFSLARTMATGAFTNGVLAGDMDGDDDVDLVSANNSISQTISVHKNNGSGVFAAPQHFAAGEGAFSQALADIDGDEDLDVLCTGTGDPNLGDLSSSAVLVFRNRGNATFDPVKNYPVGSIVEAIAPADLDGDGHVDLAVAGSLSNVWILPNDRQGGFGQPAGLNAGDGPTTVVAADFTSDGKPDLAVTNYRAASVSLFVNESTAVDRDCNDNGVPDACDIAGGTSQDGNRDGVPDECAGTAVITFLRGDCNGDGEVRGVVTDAIFLLNFNFVGGPRPGCLAACDANGDGGVIGVVTDAVYILTYNFLGGPEPVAPYPACGPGLRPADETLGCEASGCP